MSIIPNLQKGLKMAKQEANNGFIKIDRKILEWEHITEPVVLQVFLYLLLKANHKAKWHNGKMCERGATMVSIRTICEDLAMSPHTAIKALRTLEDSREVVRTQVTQKLSKTKLVNYSKYQGFNISSVADNATQSATQSATKQERKERKEIQHQQDNNTHTHEEVLNWLINSQYLEQFAMSESISTELCRKLATDAVTEWKMLGTSHRNVTDARKHLLDHIRKRVTAMRANGTLKATEDKAKRLQPFIDDCKALIDEGYQRHQVQEFYTEYTQESNDGTGRMVFETLNGWNAKYRFIQFLKRQNYGQQRKTN